MFTLYLVLGSFWFTKCSDHSFNIDASSALNSCSGEELVPNELSPLHAKALEGSKWDLR